MGVVWVGAWGASSPHLGGFEGSPERRLTAEGESGGRGSSLGEPPRPHASLPPSSILIRFISNPTAPTWWGFLVAGLMFACSTTQTLILQQYYHLIFVSALKLRMVITGVIYRKVSWNRAAGGSRGQLGECWRGSRALPLALLSTRRPWLSPIQPNGSPPWEKLSTSCLWMPSASWTWLPSST